MFYHDEQAETQVVLNNRRREVASDWTVWRRWVHTR